jgi:hypothetical protein
MWFTVWRISPSFPWAYLMWCGGGGRKPRLISVLLYKNRARPKAEKRECACASVWKFLLALPSLGELRLKRSPKNEICRVRVWERRAKWLIFMHIYEIVGFYLSGIVSLLYYWNSHLKKHCGNILTLLMGTCAAITAAHLCANFFTLHHIPILKLKLSRLCLTISQIMSPFNLQSRWIFFEANFLVIKNETKNSNEAICTLLLTLKHDNEG